MVLSRYIVSDWMAGLSAATNAEEKAFRPATSRSMHRCVMSGLQFQTVCLTLSFSLASMIGFDHVPTLGGGIVSFFIFFQQPS
jgi:hypothetical protein